MDFFPQINNRFVKKEILKSTWLNPPKIEKKYMIYLQVVNSCLVADTADSNGSSCKPLISATWGDFFPLWKVRDV